MGSWSLVAIVTLHVVGSLDIHRERTVAIFPTEAACLDALAEQKRTAVLKTTYQCHQAAGSTDESTR